MQHFFSSTEMHVCCLQVPYTYSGQVMFSSLYVFVLVCKKKNKSHIKQKHNNVFSFSRQYTLYEHIDATSTTNQQEVKKKRAPAKNAVFFSHSNGRFLLMLLVCCRCCALYTVYAYTTYTRIISF